MHPLKLFFLLVYCTFSPWTAVAQTATLLADHVEIKADTVIIASGHVEILFEDTRLTAASLEYDRAANSLIINGPITLKEGDEIVILADQAELTADLRNGVLYSASLVLDQQLQLAAAEISRVNGRYTQLYKTVASSCVVCANRPVPLWQIRARRIVHDQAERQLYFHNAQLRVAGVPIFYLPRLRLPDPTLTRARGFLIPDLSTSSTLGFGLRVPYFIPIGDHADLTLSPFFASKSTTLGARYRQAFRRGNIEFNGALSHDDILPGTSRYYLFGQGDFQLPRDFRLDFNIEYASDEAYLLDYGFSDKDRLNSSISVSRTRKNEYIRAGLLNFTTLRGSELAVDDQLPNLQAELLFERRFFPATIGGQGSWKFDLQAHNRASSDPSVGRDVLRLGGKIDWSRDWVLNNGLVARVGGRVSSNAYWISQDDTYASRLAHVTPALEAELRWPLIRSSHGGKSELLEPVVHLAWTDQVGAGVPNDDSTLVEFDEGNLFSLSRFPGSDRYEQGMRTTVGLRYTRFDPNGGTLGLTAGKVFRQNDTDQFSSASGLDGSKSDWLIAGQYRMENQFAIGARALIKGDLTLTKAETRLSWNTSKLDLASNYTWIESDPDENRPESISQLTLDATYDLSRHWESSLDWRYDLEAGKATSAKLGLAYRNECLIVNFSVSRRFTSSTSVDPTTDYGLSIALNGFGSNGRAYRRSCSG